MTDFEKRLRNDLEPLLAATDPREKISAYHDMPYALFRYDPEQEYPLRREVTMLATRLTQKGKRVTRISLAECLHAAMTSQRPLQDWYEAERAGTVEETVETITNILGEYEPLVELVAARMPADPDPRSDVVLINRTGALFPVYRTFSLLEQLKGASSYRRSYFIQAISMAHPGFVSWACSMPSTTTGPRSFEG